MNKKALGPDNIPAEILKKTIHAVRQHPKIGNAWRYLPRKKAEAETSHEANRQVDKDARYTDHAAKNRGRFYDNKTDKYLENSNNL